MTNEHLLLSARQLAAELAISLATIYNLRSSGRLPLPLRIAGSVRWRRSDIELWIECGCPSRERFEARKAMKP